MARTDWTRTMLAATALIVLSCLAVAQARHAKDEPSPDEPIIHDYILTMDKVHRYAEVSRKGAEAAKSDPALAAEMKKVGDMDGYNVQKADMMEKSPHIAAFLKSNGMTARDFVFIPMTAFTAVMAIAVEDAKSSRRPSSTRPTSSSCAITKTNLKSSTSLPATKSSYEE